MNNKGQMPGSNIVGIVLGLIGLLLFVILFTSFYPTMQTQFDGLRNQDNLNCKSTSDICGGVGSNTTCFNATVSSGELHTLSCSMISLGLPLITIGGVILGFLLIIGGGAMVAGSRRPVEYPGY